MVAALALAAVTTAVVESEEGRDATPIRVDGGTTGVCEGSCTLRRFESGAASSSSESAGSSGT